MVNTESKCYIKAKKMLDEFVANGGNVDDLGNKDEIYRYIKSARITDASGNSLDVEAKFRQKFSYHKEEFAILPSTSYIC